MLGFAALAAIALAAPVAAEEKSIVVASTASPIGVFAVSVASQLPPSSAITRVISSGIVLPLTAMVAL